MKIAVVQMQSTSDLEKNLTVMRQFVEQAKARGADIVVFPEVAYFTGAPEQSAAVAPEYSRLKKLFGDWAKDLEITLVPGTLREPHGPSGVHSNTLLVFDPAGKVVAEYRKIFLFKATLPDRQYDETKFFQPGSQLVTVEVAGATLGLSICFDLRFPELFRALKKRGAQVILLPAAFTAQTGKAHWETLLRARAIENQCFVVASGLVGTAGDGGAKYGHSLVVGPWGDILVDLNDREGLEVWDVDLSEISQCAQRVDTWGSRREDLFPIG